MTDMLDVPINSSVIHVTTKVMIGTTSRVNKMRYSSVELKIWISKEDTICAFSRKAGSSKPTYQARLRAYKSYKRLEKRSFDFFWTRKKRNRIVTLKEIICGLKKKKCTFRRENGNEIYI